MKISFFILVMHLDSSQKTDNFCFSSIQNIMTMS